MAEKPSSMMHTAPMPPLGPWAWYHSVDDHDDRDLISLEVVDTTTEGGYPNIPACKPHCTNETCGTPWGDYPRSLFPRWTDEQVGKSLLRHALDKKSPLAFKACWVDVLNSGEFSKPDDVDVYERNMVQQWTDVEKNRPADTRVRVLILEDVSGQGMKFIGTKYRIGPFFFLSSLNGSPYVYQIKPRLGVGRRITIILKFLRTMQYTNDGATQADDSQICISGKRVVALDLLAINMTMGCEAESTILSFHAHPGRSPNCDIYHKSLHKRLADCKSDPYQEMFRNNKDPAFVLLLFMWYVVYAWDEALERLYAYIDDLEKEVVFRKYDKTYDEEWVRNVTTKLHRIRGQLLSYAPLLTDLKDSVTFILEKSSPEEGTAKSKRAKRKARNPLLKEECDCLIKEIGKQNSSRDAPDKKLENIMNLVIARSSMRMTESALDDSYSMMVLSIVAMIFLPASLLAGVFGINMKELDPNTALVHFIEAAVPLTAVTLLFYSVFHRRINYKFVSLSLQKWFMKFFHDNRDGVQESNIAGFVESRVGSIDTKNSRQSASPNVRSYV